MIGILSRGDVTFTGRRHHPYDDERTDVAWRNRIVCAVDLDMAVEVNPSLERALVFETRRG